MGRLRVGSFPPVEALTAAMSSPGTPIGIPSRLAGAGELAGDLAELAERYLEAACSPPTAATYRRHLQGFLRELAGAPVTPATLVAYRAHLVRDGRGAATHRQALAAVR